MIVDRISHTSYIGSLISGDYSIDLNSQEGQDQITSLLNRTVLTGGKRLRPLLTTLFGKLVDIPSPDLHKLSKSIEYVHAASLSHDDVIDNATTRRGNPSINVVGDNKMSILSGDFLLAQVINDLADIGNINLVREMAQIIKRLSVGEWIQHDCLKKRTYNKEVFHRISLNKTSSVLEWCSVSPMIYKGHGQKLISLARSFGRNLGLSFQLYDDLLDFSSDSAKDSFLDIKNDQLTYISYRYLGSIGKIEEYQSGAKLVDLVNHSELHNIFVEVKSEADFYHDKCIEDLNEIIKNLGIEKTDINYSCIDFLLNKLKNRTK